MAKTKISQLDSLSISSLQGGDLVAIARPGVKNYKMGAEEFIPLFENAGNTGVNVYKSSSVNTHTLRKLSGDSGIVTSQYDDFIRIAFDPSAVDVADFSGIVPMSQGGLGNAVTPPIVPSIFYYDSDTGETSFLGIGAGLAIVDGELVSTVEPEVYTAGTGLVLTGTAFSVDFGFSAGDVAQGNVEIEVAAGDGMSGGGSLYVGQGGTVTLTNTDKGSSQFIFKQIVGDVGDTTASANNDSLTIIGGTGIQTSISGDILTITSTSSGGTIYDTGWLSVPTWNGSYGITHATSLPTGRTFRHRLINRTMHFKGLMLIQNEVSNDLVDIIESTDVIPNTTTAYSVVASDGRIDIGPVFSHANLYPDQDVVFSTTGYRYTKLATSGETAILQAKVWVKFSSSGVLQVLSIRHYEKIANPLGTGNLNKFRLERILTSIVEAGDYPLDFATYRTAHNGSNRLDVPTQGAGTYAMDFDGTDVDEFGGMIIDMDGLFYHCSENLNIATLNGYF